MFKRPRAVRRPARPPPARKQPNGNGHTPQDPADSDLNMRKLLRALQAMRDGDFSVRLPTDQTGLSGKVADTFNAIVAANERMARELERAGQVVGKDGKTRHRMSNELRSGAWGAMENSVNTLIDDLLWPNTEVTRTIAGVVKGDLSQAMALEVGRSPAEGRVPAFRHDRERDDRADERVHLRGDARGARGRHRKASWVARPWCPAPPAPGRT